VSRLCGCIGVSSSGYYQYKKGSQKSELAQKIERRVIAIFRQHKRRYGTRRIVSELLDEGIKVGRERVSSILKANGLKAIQPKSFVPRTTKTDPRLRRSPNLLLAYGKPTEPNQVWVGDITYLPMTDGTWSYLATWLDIWGHVIVGWAIADHMEEGLVTEALETACTRRRPPRGLILHTDGGGQYGAIKFREQLTRRGIRQSMTRKDNVYDNAYAESLFSRIKMELMDGGKFMTMEDARKECFEYIDGYYNTQRKHSSIGYKKPFQFERELGY